VYITTIEPDTKSNPNPNPNRTTKQRAVVSILHMNSLPFSYKNQKKSVANV